MYNNSNSRSKEGIGAFNWAPTIGKFPFDSFTATVVGVKELN